MPAKLSDLVALSLKSYIEGYGEKIPTILKAKIINTQGCCVQDNKFLDDVNRLKYIKISLMNDHLECFEKLFVLENYGDIFIKDFITDCMIYNSSKCFEYICENYFELNDLPFLIDLLGLAQAYDNETKTSLNTCWLYIQKNTNDRSKRFLSKIIIDNLPDLVPDEHCSCLMYLKDPDFIGDPDYNICTPACQYINALDRLLACSLIQREQLYQMCHDNGIIDYTLKSHSYFLSTVRNDVDFI